MKILRCICLIIIALAVRVAAAQHVEINNQNKTIAVSADASVSVDSDIATLHIGYHSYAKSKDDAFKDNLTVANAISARLTELGIRHDQIESSDVSLGRVDPEDSWTPEDKRDRKFKAHQGWNIKLPVSQAETVLQSAINAGANESTEPDWEVADRSALQAKAGAAALAKA